MRRCPVLGLILALGVSPGLVAGVSGAGSGSGSGVIGEGARAIWVSSFTWRSSDAEFGGISGFSLGPDGLTFRAVEDTGITFTGRLGRDAEGRVIGVAALPFVRLRGAGGQPLGEEDWDAEAVAPGPGQSFFVAFERNDRIVRYPRDGAPPEVLTEGLDLSWVTYNKGFEALAADGRGGLWAISEDPVSRRKGHPALSFDGTGWRLAFSIPAEGTWRVTDADFGPDGRLYVLQRDFWGLVGFRSRVLRLSLAGSGLAGIETLFETQAGRHDNLEGLSVWADAAGAIRLTMVSDDNFNILQRTEIVDYRVEE
ncbi:MAG: esterase-like activity of phytase family protein [Paracoccaceae bacterium]